MRKINRLKLEMLELQAKLYDERLTMLECEHEPIAAEKRPFDLFGISFVDGWQLACSKCGKGMGDLTEREYLELKLESDENSFLGCSEEMKVRLAELIAQEVADVQAN